MKIDYFCFSIPRLGETDYVINKEDDENVRWIKSKDQELLDLTRKHNMAIFFDRTTKKFYDEVGEIDVKDKVIFPRSFISYADELLERLEVSGAISIQTRRDTNLITYWPSRVQPLHRTVIMTTYKEFQQNYKSYKSIFSKVFLKTAKKSSIRAVLSFYGGVTVDGKDYFIIKPYLWDLGLEDEIFLSDAFESIEDTENNMRCREYRAFIVGGKVLSLSRSYVDYPTLVPDKVKDFVSKQVNRISNIKDFPLSYVLDVGEVNINGKDVVDIIEFNPIAASGLEVCNLLEEEILSIKKTGNGLIYK